MKPTVLQLGPMLPLVEQGLAENYTAHNLGKAPDRARFLAEVGPAVQAVASSVKTPVDAALLDALPNARLVANFGVGYENVDVEQACATRPNRPSPPCSTANAGWTCTGTLTCAKAAA